MGKLKDLRYKKFGMLTVTERFGSDKHGIALWLCDCDCGFKGCVVRGRALISGATKSCGCIRVEIASNKFKEMHKKRASAKEAKKNNPIKLYNETGGM